MGGDRRRVKVEDHLLGRRPGRPRPRLRLRPRRAQPVQLGLADIEHHAPRRGDRCHVPEQRRLRAERDQIRHAPPAVGQHHRQITEHAPRVMRRAALTRLASAHPSASVSPNRSAANGNSAVPARDESPVPSARTSTFWMLERPITFKVRLLSGREGPRQPQLRCSGGRFNPRAGDNPPAYPANRG
jgi:hypothetical protein